jgi:threonylcarbamoyladenosine tRNA methylthiotransferase CDKAL1
MNREYTRREFDLVADGLHAAFPTDQAAALNGAATKGSEAGAHGSDSDGHDDDDGGDDGGLTLATDMICGFPGEGDDDHARSLELCRTQRFPVLNISQFYARPGTPAAKMRRVPNGVAKARSRELTHLFNAQTPHGARLVGRVVTVWVDTETATAPAAAATDALRPRGSPGDVGAGGGDDGDLGAASLPGGQAPPPEAVHQTVGHTKSYVKVLVPLNPELVGCVARVRVTTVHRWHVEGSVLR